MARRRRAPGAGVNGVNHGDDTDALTQLRGWHSELREQFPILANHPGLAYLDSAATSQKPRAVLDAVREYLVTGNANAGRGTYPWANATTAALEAVRGKTRAFLGDPEPDRSSVHFVSGTTEGLRAIALDWLAPQLADGDEILVPFEDHQANLVPWREAQRQLARAGVRVAVRPLPYQASSGDYDHRALPRLVGPRTRFVAATHVHHVLGGDMNVHRLRAAVGPDVPICLDAAQSVGHLPISLAELDVDFLVFSGHKALALPGTGAVWARDRRGPAFRPGGWSGTPNTVGVISLGAALDWLTAADVGRIERWTVALAARLTEGLRHLPPYEVLGCQLSLAADATAQRRRGIVSFRHRDLSSNDLGFILHSHGFLVRADGLCRAGVDPDDPREAAVRVSLHVHNTPEEIDGLLAVLDTLD
ncbi:aminotransferase class V-fold PLP-dependent enzyme [Streptomyces sp. 3MP-14]|uniref:Aminotransferase class V-fold PLP-dependent enzyme n=1 Tax=Streptomyces mimosae TaxID=2586635 RepID=A0A5N5ZUZ5_9ACTN|nr:aminotransferase class V-fold PLP-dependent enzyme [Streptomyces mimosae]KAB8173021.1 aminotransferase class V-fold PLP-dependent enzyme [Streptomyces sp. 3MP-14]